MMKISFVIIFTLIYQSILGQIGNFELERIPQDKELSQAYISCISQDKYGFIWVGTNFGINRYDGFHFTSFLSDDSDKKGLPGNEITTLFKDKQGNLFAGTSKGMAYFDYDQNAFVRLNLGESSDAHIRFIFQDQKGVLWVSNSKSGLIGLSSFSGPSQFELIQPKIENEIISILSRNTKIYQNKEGKFYFISKKQTITAQLSDNQSFEFSLPLQLKEPKDSRNNQFSLQSKDESIWSKKKSGWIVNDASNDSILLPKIFLPNYAYKKGNNCHPDYGNQIIDKKGNWWLGGYTGHLIVYNQEQNKFVKVLSNTPIKQKEIKRDFTNIPFIITALFEDFYGNIWVGTNGTGLYIYKASKPNFNSQGQFGKLTGVSLRSMIETKDGLLWFVDAQNFLYNYNSVTKETKRITSSLDNFSSTFGTGNKAPFSIVTELKQMEDGTVWALHNSSILKLNFKGDQIESVQDFHTDVKFKALGIIDYPVSTLIKENNVIWLRGKSELLRLNLTSNELQDWKIPKSNQEIISKLSSGQPTMCLQNNYIWMSTQEGLIRFDKKLETWKTFPFFPLNDNIKCAINSIQIDTKNPNLIWLTSATLGLIKFEIATGKVQIFDDKDGVPNSFAYHALIDQKERVWISTNNGLCYFDPSTEEVVQFDESFGLQANEFNGRAFYQSKSGEFFFGGINGLNRFFPEVIHKNNKANEVQFNALLFNNKVLPKDSKFNNKTLLNSNDASIYIPSDVQVITFNFISLEYAFSESMLYEYYLEGFDKEWQPLGKQRSVVFTNLSTGKYCLKIRSKIGRTGNFNKPKEITFTVLAPWYSTTLAYFIYMCLFLLIVYFIFSLIFKRRQATNETIRIKEMDAIKNKFFANISHEIRTPLTLINGIPSELRISYQQKNDQKFYNDLEIIERNGAQLLHQVNQLLELSKIESMTIKLAKTPVDLLELITNMLPTYEEAGRQKNIRFEISSTAKNTTILGDQQALSHIFQNLLSNALKFTPVGTIYIQLKQDLNEQILVQIKDEGIGIKSEFLPKIFDRFFQVDDESTREYEGTGIGLALAKELVTILNGKIEVTSEFGKGSTFSVFFPLLEIKGRPIEPNIQEGQEKIETNNSKELILIVEDNPDMQLFISGLLEKDYSIDIANNGLEGLEKAKKRIPDFIISDWMMPKMDGPSMIELLKKDQFTSHIPCLLLTAKSSTSNRIKGLTVGAESYLTKPFNTEELKAQIKSLIAAKRLMQLHFTKKDIETDKDVYKVEQLFMDKIKQIVLQNLDNVEFSGESLAKAMNYSRSQFSRKLKAITGESITHYIRTVRMEKAKILLRDFSLSISEVAYQTGFDDPSYFTRIFTQFYSESPSDYRKSFV